MRVLLLVEGAVPVLNIWLVGVDFFPVFKMGVLLVVEGAVPAPNIWLAGVDSFSVFNVVPLSALLLVAYSSNTTSFFKTITIFHAHI